jgi:hypothetical protein
VQRDEDCDCGIPSRMPEQEIGVRGGMDYVIYSGWVVDRGGTPRGCSQLAAVRYLADMIFEFLSGAEA